MVSRKGGGSTSTGSATTEIVSVNSSVINERSNDRMRSPKAADGLWTEEPLLSGVRELGRGFKTEFILDYFSQPPVRKRIRRELLEGEKLHALGRDSACLIANLMSEVMQR